MLEGCPGCVAAIDYGNMLLCNIRFNLDNVTSKDSLWAKRHPWRSSMVWAQDNTNSNRCLPNSTNQRDIVLRCIKAHAGWLGNEVSKEMCTEQPKSRPHATSTMHCKVTNPEFHLCAMANVRQLDQTTTLPRHVNKGQLDQTTTGPKENWTKRQLDQN
jgi:hypothetical protein